ncbi:MAG TPA: YhjD/YihY/BrkB family envelope integrity protein, partial [Solirubrobacteraceae bacterium]|nr:YhjD/YihY/BrkB family envelope integrity protein [Solirubrobacteraceae bacterium]
MDPLAPVRALDRVQHRHRWLGVPFAVFKKFSDDQGGSLAALVAYYGFVSLFPLLLVMTTVLGFVLNGNPGAQKAVENSVLGQFPVIGSQIHLHALSGSVTSLVIGLVIALFGGLGVTNAAQNAFDRIWAVPFKDRPDFLRTRLHGLLLLACIGVLFILSTAISGVASGIGGTGFKVASYAISLVVNFVLFLAAFRFLTSNTIPTRHLWIGVA